VLDDLGVHPLEDRGSGGTADAVVNVRGEHDTTELVVEAVDEVTLRRLAVMDTSSDGTSSWQKRQSGMSARSAAVDRRALRAGSSACTDRRWRPAAALSYRVAKMGCIPSILVVNAGVTSVMAVDATA
jgi:hypothetical protein